MLQVEMGFTGFTMAPVLCCRSALPLPADPSEHIAPAYSNAAAVLHGINDLRYEEAPSLPQTVAPGAVRVAIKAVGICRSDVHYLQKVDCVRFASSARRLSCTVQNLINHGVAAAAMCVPCASAFEAQLTVRCPSSSAGPHRSLRREPAHGHRTRERRHGCGDRRGRAALAGEHPSSISRLTPHT